MNTDIKDSLDVAFIINPCLVFSLYTNSNMDGIIISSITKTVSIAFNAVEFIYKLMCYSNTISINLIFEHRHKNICSFNIATVNCNVLDLTLTSFLKHNMKNACHNVC